MKHTRHGFTMIELIFVIVIIGILAGVALPRFVGVSEDAHLSKLKAFVGTLNRTVAPSMWSSLINNKPQAKGSILNAPAGVVLTDRYKKIYAESTKSTITPSSDLQYAQVESMPSEFTQDFIDLTACVPSNTLLSSILTQAPAISTAQPVYHLVCKDGSLTNPPHFYLLDGNKTTILAQ